MNYHLQGTSVLVDVAEGVATVTLNRPDQHNALSRELRNNLVTVLRALNNDDEVSVIIFTGSGNKAFSVGADLKEFETSPLKVEELGVESDFMKAFAELRKPTIAAINGYTITGGFELAVNCDILVASTSAKFADTHARVGVVSAWGLTQYLAQMIGPVRARYLSFTGNYLDAKTAKEWGLVLEVVEPTELLPYCLSLAKDMISCDQSTLRDLRDAIRYGLNTTIEKGLAYEGKLARDSLERFDPATFAVKRTSVMNRGKQQSV